MDFILTPFLFLSAALIPFLSFIYYFINSSLEYLIFLSTSNLNIKLVKANILVEVPEIFNNFYELLIYLIESDISSKQGGLYSLQKLTKLHQYVSLLKVVSNLKE